MRLMGFPGSEAGFRAVEKAADVLVVLDDDEQGDGELDGDKEGSAVSADQEPGKEGKAGRAQDGGQRDVAAEEQYEEEDGDGGQTLRQGAATRKTPKPVATPLPPRKRSQTGNMWPRTAKRAAMAWALRRAGRG